MSATEGQTTGLENPTSSAALQLEAIEAHVWVAPSGIVLTQGGTSDGATLEEAIGAPNVSDSHVHTEEYLRSAERGMRHQKYGQRYGSGGVIPDVYFRHDEYVSHETTPEEDEFYHGMARGGYNAGMQGDYGPYSNMGFQDHSYQEHGHLNQGAPEGSLCVNTMFQGKEAYHLGGGGYTNYMGPYAFAPYCTAQAPTIGAIPKVAASNPRLGQIAKTGKLCTAS
ncbi:hypothetical protein FH972_002437 [Carpinus fangiana]|uniref:Uncharacterized protein n=1 Tax=Carpinus fangiana TaxID=176857 RepID=A0A5N6QEV2_9ROSI|nr:hypothetical protein FH972_002437 [Carpinus fangiana]